MTTETAAWFKELSDTHDPAAVILAVNSVLWNMGNTLDQLIQHQGTPSSKELYKIISETDEEIMKHSKPVGVGESNGYFYGWNSVIIGRVNVASDSLRKKVEQELG
jgi:hypothetical protein